MVSFFRTAVPLGALALALLPISPPRAAGQELAAFLPVHKTALALANKGKWAQAAAEYERLAAARPRTTDGGLAAILGGFILLRELGKPDEALRAFAQAASLNVASDGAARPNEGFAGRLAHIARAWVARIRMEKLDAALHTYWVRHVEYPAKLEALAQEKLVPPELLRDPWGKPFDYRTSALSAVPDLPRQSYRLRCGTTGADSRDFEAAVKRTGELPRLFELRAIGGSRPLSALLRLRDGDSKAAHVAEGERFGPAVLIRLTKQVAVLADGDVVAALSL